MQGFDVKSCAGFWCRNLCNVLVEKALQDFAVKAVQSFGVECCEAVWWKKLCRVLVQIALQGFVAKSCAVF